MSQPDLTVRFPHLYHYEKISLISDKISGGRGAAPKNQKGPKTTDGLRWTQI